MCRFKVKAINGPWNLYFFIVTVIVLLSVSDGSFYSPSSAHDTNLINIYDKTNNKTISKGLRVLIKDKVALDFAKVTNNRSNGTVKRILAIHEQLGYDIKRKHRRKRQNSEGIGQIILKDTVSKRECT